MFSLGCFFVFCMANIPFEHVRGREDYKNFVKSTAGADEQIKGFFLALNETTLGNEGITR